MAKSTTHTSFWPRANHKTSTMCPCSSNSTGNSHKTICSHSKDNRSNNNGNSNSSSNRSESKADGCRTS